MPGPLDGMWPVWGLPCELIGASRNVDPFVEENTLDAHSVKVNDLYGIATRRAGINKT
tara:strand:+ start:251 stop:424 length:174 start_codon:yes stop_codon:yes gene_type:complete